MHVGNNAGDSAGLLSFLGGKRRIGTGAEEKKETIFGRMGGAIRYTLLISMLLWWIPIFGQAFAGYVGGRKAGTPATGMVATLLSVLVLLAIVTLLGMYALGGLDFLTADPGEMVAAIGADFPVVGWLMTGIMTYLQAFFGMITGTTSMKLNIYIITVVFGLIGGVLAEQHAKEAAKRTPGEGEKVYVPRSLAAYVQGKKLGFGSFDDRLAIQQSKAPEQKIVTVHRTLVRKETSREEPKALPEAAPTPAVQQAEQRESPFAGLIHRAERNDPEKERVRHSSSQEDLEYV